MAAAAAAEDESWKGHSSTDAASLFDESSHEIVPEEDNRPPRTIQEQMIQNGISFSFSDHDYHACLAVMNCVLGFQPTMNQFAKVWGEAGFWSFHLMFKNSMNLPFSMLCGDIQDLFLVVYASSREGGCDYCTAHSVGLALRTGALPDRIVCEGSDQRRDKALYTVSKALSRFPADLSTDEVIDLKRHFTTDKIEWIVLTIAASGYLNILGLAGGLALEGDSLDEQAWLVNHTQWQSNHVDWDEPPNLEQAHIPNPQLLSILLKATKYMPSAILQEAKWTYGVPMTWPKVSTYLAEQVGYAFPLLKHVSHFRIMTVSYGCIMRDNFTLDNTRIGIVNKVLIQMMTGGYFSDQFLQDDAEELMQAMVKRHNLPKPSDEVLDAVYDLASQPEPPHTPEACHAQLDQLSSILVGGDDAREDAAILLLARAVMQRPTKVEPVMVQEVAALLTDAQSCEIIHWVGMMVALHRVLRYKEVRDHTPTHLWETNDPVTLHDDDNGEVTGTTMDGGQMVSKEFTFDVNDRTSVKRHASVNAATRGAYSTKKITRSKSQHDTSGTTTTFFNKFFRRSGTK